MAQTPEGLLKKAVKKALTEQGFWYFMPMQNGMGVVGIPDFIVCARGLFVAIETKAPGKLGRAPGLVIKRGPVVGMPAAVTANQRNRLGEIRACGGVAVAIDDMAQLHELLTYLRKRRSRVSYLLRIAARVLRKLQAQRRAP